MPTGELATTVVTYEEQISGHLAVVRRASKSSERIQAFFWLQETLTFFCRIPVLPFDETAATVFQQLTTEKLRIGTQDLLIAAVALSKDAILLTRNRRDFQRVPGLVIEDWSILSN